MLNSTCTKSIGAWTRALGLVFTLVIACSSFHAQANNIPFTTTYQAVACGGIYPPCQFVPFRPTTTTPPDTSGLTDTLIRQSLGLGSSVYVGWHHLNYNDNGYVIAQFISTYLETSYFVYHAGTICCLVNGNQGLLMGINDNNIIVGEDSLSNQQWVGNFGGVVWDCGDGRCTGETLHILPDPKAGIPMGEHVYYAAINNENQIFAEADPGNGQLQDFVLDPVPEPASALLFVTVLAAIVALKNRGTRGHASAA